MEDARGGQADAENVVARRKSDVAADGSHRGPAEGNGLRDDAQVLSVEFQSGRLAGQLAARTHGDARRGGGHGRGVVDAVANEEDLASGRAQFFHLAQFRVGGESGQTLVEAEARRVFLAVAGHDDGADAECFHLCHGFAGRIAERLADHGQTAKASVAADENLVAAFFLRGELGVQRFASVTGCEDAVIADLQRRAVGQGAFEACARQHTNRAGQKCGVRGWSGPEGAGDGVSAAGLHRGDFAQQLRPVHPGSDDKIDKACIAFAQRAGFVEDGGINQGERFDRVAPAGEESAFGQGGEGRPNGDRRGQSHGAGAGDEEDGEAVEHPGDPAALQGPAEGGQRSDDQHEREEPRDKAIGLALDASGIFARFLDRAEEGIEPAGASARDRGDTQGALLHAASRQDAVARALDHRVGLAGQGSLGN